MSENKVTLNDLILDAKELNQLQKALFAYLGGTLDSWAIIIEENPELISTVIKDMKELAAKLRKISGVTVVD